MYQLERMKCGGKGCGMKLSWVSTDPRRSYPPALARRLCKVCYEKQLGESDRKIDRITATQSGVFKAVIDTTDPEWRRDHYGV